MSRLSWVFCVSFLVYALNSFGQQKANDFTKRVVVFDGKMSSLSGRTSNFSRLSPSSARRISVVEWPSHYSSFGGKRFPLGNAKILGKERITSPRIDITTPYNDQLADENFERASNQNLSKRDPAIDSVEFRDAYYARLNDRVDQWMDKVNNMSLRDINRYQFRRDRSKEPGFPVQRAGADGMDGAKTQSTVRGTGLPSARPKSIPHTNQSYWMGPKKIKSSSSSTSTSSQRQSFSGESQSTHSSKNFRAAPKPILGPKTIRVQVDKAE